MLTKRQPSDTAKTVFGKLFGTLNHEWHFMRLSAECSFWYSLVPDVWFFGVNLTGWVKDTVKTIFQKSYDNTYQKVYDLGATQGDRVYNDMVGGFERLTADYKSRIQTAYDDLKGKINEVQRMVDDAKNKVTALNQDVAKVQAYTVELEKSLKSFEGEVKKKLRELEDRVKKLEGEVGRSGWWGWLKW